MKLLVAIDSSLASSTLVDEVARRPWPSGTMACVLHIIDWQQLPSGALIQSAKQSADVLVKTASDKLGKAGLRATVKVLEGHPRTEVAKYARKWDADLVLVGSHGTSGLVRFLLGSVAQAVLRRSPCSVEIVRWSARGAVTASPTMKILIGSDGSDCAMTAVRSVARRPWPPGSQMQVISVIPRIDPFFAAISLPPALVYPSADLAGTTEKLARDRAEEVVTRARQILAESGIEAIGTECLPVGDARQVLLDRAHNWGADLIVVGSHGYRGVDRFLLGSVSEAVAMHADCSVEVIRECSTAVSQHYLPHTKSTPDARALYHYIV